MNKFSMPQSMTMVEPVRWVLAAAPQHERRDGTITLVTGGRGYTQPRMHALLVELALERPVKVLIGDNRYDHYRVNYTLAAATPCYEHILDQHIFLSRAETCYQMVELLAETRADSVPCLVLDLLATFYDEGVPEREINQLLFEAILELRRLSRGAKVTVSARAGQDRPQLLEALKRTVDRIEEPPLSSFPSSRQPALIG